MAAGFALSHGKAMPMRREAHTFASGHDFDRRLRLVEQHRRLSAARHQIG
jgi:hypothetical protein